MIDRKKGLKIFLILFLFHAIQSKCRRGESGWREHKNKQEQGRMIGSVQNEEQEKHIKNIVVSYVEKLQISGIGKGVIGLPPCFL
jgi:hypothetical protein